MHTANRAAGRRRVHVTKQARCASAPAGYRITARAMRHRTKAWFVANPLIGNLLLWEWLMSSKALSGATVPCAMITGPSFVDVESRDPNMSTVSTFPVFCAPGGVGELCTDCSKQNVGNETNMVCSNGTARWWQAALDWAGVAASTTPATNMSLSVYVSPTIIEVSEPLEAWHPLGTSTGVHVPSRVYFGGLCADQPVTILPSPSLGNATARLWSLLLIAGPRTGHPPMWPQRAVSAGVHNLILSGVSAQDVPNWRHCDLAESALGVVSSSVVPVSKVRVARGIFVPYAADNVHVQNCTVLHMFGNAIETGVFDQWEPENPEDKMDPSCNNGTRFCQGKVYDFRGAAVQPNAVSNNFICTTCNVDTRK